MTTLGRLWDDIRTTLGRLYDDTRTTLGRRADDFRTTPPPTRTVWLSGHPFEMFLLSLRFLIFLLWNFVYLWPDVLVIWLTSFLWATG